MAKKICIATLDIETSDGLKGSKFAVGGFYYKKYRVGKKGELKEYFVIERDKKTFFKKVFECLENLKTQEKGYKTICYIHNEDFDIRFILDYCLTELNINPFIIQTNSRILEVRIQEYSVIFRDSFQFLLCSQEEAEETFLDKKVKYELNFIDVLNDLNGSNKKLIEKAYIELTKRVKSDILGLYQILEKLFSLYKTKFNVNFYRYVTLPSLSLAIFKKYLKKDFNIKFLSLNPYMTLTRKKKGYSWVSQKMKRLYEWTRLSYFGGRCEVFDLNYLKKIYYYDFNSLYPSMCVKEKFPTPNKFFVLEKPTLKYFFDNIRGKELYIIEAKVKEKQFFPILPLRDEESVKFLNGEKKGVWASPEFERFLDGENNLVLEIKSIKVYKESRRYLKNFMNDRFDNRKEFDLKDLKAQSEIEKLIMTSLTGKPAQKPQRESWVLYNESIKERLIFENKAINMLEYSSKYKLIKYETESLRDYMLVDWTIFITSYSRLYLYDMFMLLIENGLKVFYCDTDCIFTNQPLEVNLNFKNLVGSALGQLKNELVPKDYLFDKELIKYKHFKTNKLLDIPFIDEAKFYLPKVYVLKKDKMFDVKVKGISTFMIYETLGIPLIKNEETKEELTKILNSFERIEELLFNSGVAINRYLKYKSSLRRNKKIVSYGRIEKRITKIYDKRKILENWETEPLDSSELKDLEKVRTQNLNNLLNNDNMKYLVS